MMKLSFVAQLIFKITASSADCLGFILGSHSRIQWFSPAEFAEEVRFTTVKDLCCNAKCFCIKTYNKANQVRESLSLLEHN
uniref:Secreted protein n=1 Tax=Octopus bimaculoides TaxID=37653 RepID=A0A0L8FSY6_OCTBM